MRDPKIASTNTHAVFSEVSKEVKEQQQLKKYFVAKTEDRRHSMKTHTHAKQPNTEHTR